MSQKNPKIVHVVEGFIGGLATYMSHVLPELSRDGYEVTLVCSLHRKERGISDKLRRLSESGVTVLYMPMRRGVKPLLDVYCVLLLWRLLRKGKYDVIHTHCSKAGAVGRMAAFMAGIKVRLHSSHCFAYLRSGSKFGKMAYFWVERVLGMLTTRYIAVSQSDYENAYQSKLFPESKVVLVENGIPVSMIDLKKSANVSMSDYGIPSHAPVILTGCRFIVYKGLELVLEAARSVQADCHFVIAGEGRQETALKRYIAKYRLEDKVSVLSPTVSMDGLLSVSSAAILCSAIEGQPYILLEAMMAKCPVIATNVPGNRELIGANRGLLVSPDAKEIAQAIETVLVNRSLRDQYKESAYRYVVKHHCLENQVYRLSMTYLSEIKHMMTDYAGLDADGRLTPKTKAI